jgi:putative ABC transport system ATP-binding protein
VNPPECSSSAPHLLELRTITKRYGTGEAAVWALCGVSVAIDRGEFVAAMGPSGSGKSTWLHILGCLDAPTSGTYLFSGIDAAVLSPDERALLRRHEIGFIFQGYHLLPRESAIHNVELPLVYRGMGAAERRERALDALHRVGLAGREAHFPNELSGGQQQRVAIARAIVGMPKVLLADEPTGNLDSMRSMEIMEILAELSRASALTVVVVTHDPKVAAFAQRTIHFLDGRIQSDESSKGSS